MSHLWYACCHWLCARYFERITVLHPDRLPAGGPTLYVGLHRNGAVDGFVYHQVAPRGVFLISTQLRRSFFARLFFCGIAIARKGDEEDRRQNDEALRECMQLLSRGGELIIFPEGTSSLGPRHLPFKSGAARLAVDALEQGIPLRIVPLGIHYECAWAFRSTVEVMVGEPIAADFAAGTNPMARLRELKRRINTALESVGANFPSAETQEDAQRVAYAATLGTPHSYFAALKPFEAGIPEPLLAGWRELTPLLSARRVLRHQGVPLFPAGPWMFYLLLLLGFGPIVLAGALVNAPPLFLGWLAARKFADDRNVIALWRILVGLPVAAIWLGVVSITLAFLSGWAWSLVYLLLTIAALKSLCRARKLGIAVWNGLAHRDLAPQAHEFHKAILQSLAP